MLVIFGFALLILTIGMLVLFAMFGELSSRVAEAEPQTRSTEIVPLENARLGHIPDIWPAELPGEREDLSVLLVLSSACSSCDDIATQLHENPSHAQWNGMAIVVSTAHRGTAGDFIARHELDQFPHYIDEGGSWVTGEFGVQSSPSALVFHGGALLDAYMFHDVGALRTKVSQSETPGVQQQHDLQQQREAV